MVVLLPVTVPVPVTLPLTVQVVPTVVAQASPDWPLLDTRAMAWATVRLVDGVGVSVALTPLTAPTTSNVLPPTSGKRTVIVAPCRGVPTVVPVQVVCRAEVTALQLSASTPPVVGMNTAGVPPTSAFEGPAATRLKVVEPVMVNEPVTLPVTVHTCPTPLMQTTPDWPELAGTFNVVGTTPVPPMGVPVGTVVGVSVLVGIGVAVHVAVGVTVAVGGRVAVAVTACWSILLKDRCGLVPSGAAINWTDLGALGPGTPWKAAALGG
jgi:hypothetical protein